jgi:cytochrome c-type biogenesis protein CcmF
MVGDYALRVRSVKQVERQFSGTDFIARMHVEVTYGDRVFSTYPMLVFDRQNRLPVLVDSYIDTLNLRLAFVTALPEEDRVVLRVLQKQAQPDYIVVNAIAKPWINLLWLGTFVMAFGFIAAIVRRVGERQGVESRTPEA